jgi:hypothetical protein
VLLSHHLAYVGQVPLPFMLVHQLLAYSYFILICFKLFLIQLQVIVLYHQVQLYDFFHYRFYQEFISDSEVDHELSLDQLLLKIVVFKLVY